MVCVVKINSQSYICPSPTKWISHSILNGIFWKILKNTKLFVVVIPCVMKPIEMSQIIPSSTTQSKFVTESLNCYQSNNLTINMLGRLRNDN